MKPIAILRYLDSDGREPEILDRVHTSIGRSSDRDIVLRESLVSRKHAVITRDGDTWTITDQDSSQGTYVNLVRTQRTVLRSGDILQFGSLEQRKLQFLITEVGAPTHPTEQTSLHQLLSSMDDLERPTKETRQVREFKQLTWLIQAARQLNDGTGISEILGALLELTLQLTGVERGFVFLWIEGKLQFAQGLSSSGATLVEEKTISRTAIENAIRSKSRFSISDTGSDALASGWLSVILHEIRSIYCIPLRERAKKGETSRLLGLLYLDSRIEPGALSEIDDQLLDMISTEAAALLHNALLGEVEQKARQAREELAVAARIHSDLMSRALPEVLYAEVRAMTVPCLAIGGDFYDAVALDDCVCATIVDVSGKGVSAAIVAATLQGIIHAQLRARTELRDIAAAINQFLYTRNVGKYATLIILKLFADGRVEYINCGHLLPLAIDGKGIRRLEANNLMVGLLPDATYASAEDRLKPGERILLVTDGITEAENEDGRQFDEVWLSVVTEYQSIGEILEEVSKFQGLCPAQDDATVMELRYTGGE